MDSDIITPLLLTRIKTRDNIFLDGIAVLPRHRTDMALIWIHGLGSNFSHSHTLIKDLSAQCVKNRIAYFKFNTRGHDIVNHDGAKKKYLQGSAFEKFEECIADIRAMIRYARAQKYKNIILAGHSTGANKTLYYLYKTKDRSVKGLMLLGPANDKAAGLKKFGRAALARGIILAEKLRRKDPDSLMPRSYGIFSAARFLSMFRAGGAEDVFPYLNPHAGWRELKSIRAPIAIIFGSRDEYLDRPAQKLMEVFRDHAPLAKSFSGVIIRGANHGFKNKEKELSDAIIRFINGL